mmetsp:Transcript_43630/g.102901  ORF Transcript_43630/g.102901 Transcript_43630/m.102901 type:complete len:1021 (+) Transcript_43630:114-3176(+)
MEFLDGLLDNLQELLPYNRENYFFDAKMKLEREYQEQNIRVKQFELYRQDVRDLVALTTGKMDSYLAPAAVMLSGCIVLLIEGQLADAADPFFEDNVVDDQEWLIWLYVISLAQAILYFLLSMWLALHASVAAHSFGVRLLTQFVRLPVPDRSKLDAARTYAAEFEGQSIQEILRVPLWKKQLEKMADALGDGGDEEASTASVIGGQAAEDVMRASTTATNATASMDNLGSEVFVGSNKLAVLSLRHVRLYRDLQSNWQAHDAYARVCLALGTYTLVHAFAYYTVGLLSIKLQSPIAAIGTAVALSAVAWFLTNLDLSIKSWVLLLGAIALMSGPLLTAISLSLFAEGDRFFHRILVLAIFVQHGVLIGCVTYVARGEQLERNKSQEERERGEQQTGVALPTRFRMVLYLDVFGWIDDPGSALVKIERKAPVAPPPGLWSSGRDQCWQVAAGIYKELLVWERAQKGAATMLSSQKSRRVSELRRAFNDITTRLPRPDAEATDQGATSRRNLADVTHDLDRILTATPQSVPVWLYVEDYYFRPEPFESNPLAPVDAVVSYLDNVREDVSTLRKGLKNLQAIQSSAIKAHRHAVAASRRQDGGTAARPPLRHSASAAASGMTVTRRVGRAGGLNMEGDDMTSSSVSVSSSTDSGLARWSASSENVLPGGPHSEASTQLTLSSQVAETRSMTSAPTSQRQAPGSQEHASAQVRTFGGDEAAQTDTVAAQPFYYHRQDGRSESLRPPGQVPWRVFLIVSCLLMFVWVSGLVWYGWQSIFILYKVHHLNYQARVGRTGLIGFTDAVFGQIHRMDAFAEAASLTSLDIVGLACHESYGGTILVADRFKVYKLDTTSRTQRLQQVASIDACLENEPEFQSAGLSDVHLECPSDTHCVAVLESTGRNSFLQCPLKRHRAPSTATERSLPSVGMQSLHVVHSGRKQAARTPQNLEPPHRLLYSPGPSLLPGTLRAGAASTVWRLPGDRRWKQVCAAPGKLYGLGSPQGGSAGQSRAGELWTFHVPQARL